MAHIDGKVAFVDGALPGEVVEAQYVRRRRQLDELKVLSIESPSEYRVDAGCEFAQQCGGCSLRHFQADQQLVFKESVLLEHLQHTAGLEASEFELLPRITGEVDHYRRKARLAVRVVAKKGGALVGFREKYSTFITDMDSCQVLVREVALLLPVLRELISSLDTATHIPQIEVAVGERAAPAAAANQIALVLRHLQPLTEADEQKLICFAQQHELDLYLQPGGPASVFKMYPDSEARLRYFLPDFNLQMQFHPQDFTQVNATINRKIVNRTFELLMLNSSDRVLDLFCGLGNFTLPIAQSCYSILGVEGSEEMVRRAADNAILNNIENAEFVCADLSNPAQSQTWKREDFDKILLDPPRSGAWEILPQIASCQAKLIVYVSCNPATLARDASELLKHGYRLKSAGVMDMFPHTAHVESMAVFVPA